MKNVAIICGGDSGEFEISVKSAQVVKQNLDPERYNSKIIVVSKKGWYGLLKDGTRVDVDKNDFSISVGGHRTKFDVAFNAVHGEPGENGPLSGYLELLGIPCTSSPLTTCALTFHKDFCKRVVASYGVKVAPSILINEGDKQLTLRLFNSEGDSSAQSIILPSNVVKMQHVDLLGNVVDEVPVKSRGGVVTASVSMPRFAVNTYRLYTK